VPSQAAGASKGALNGAPASHPEALAAKCSGGAHVPVEGEQVHGLHEAAGGVTRSPCPWYATTGASAGQLGAVPAGPTQRSPGPCQSNGGTGAQTPEQEELAPASAVVASVLPSVVEPSGQGSFRQCPGQGSIMQQPSPCPFCAWRPMIGYSHG